ncbi:MAG TPA: prepilin peptidase [Patescibacteria group bacterium]|nr:prepilin peptidase [Patescibacteria group bacterium]
MTVEIAFFLLGLFFGSFFNVLIDRIPKGEQFLKGRSHCEYCLHPLSWYDLIPIISFLSTGGKCRYCHKKLSWKYPGFELLTGILFALTYFLLPEKNLTSLLYFLFLTSIFIVVFFIDLQNFIIPFVIVLPGIVIAYLYLFFIHPESLFTSFLSAIGAAFFFLILFLLTKGKGMGFGDVVYAFFMGSVLGFPGILVGLYIAFILGAIIGLLYVILKKKKFHGTAIPFGPFLVLGTFLSLFLNYHWFFQLLGLPL